MGLRKGVLKSFNSGAYTTTIQLASNYKVYPEDVAVVQNLPAAEMIQSRKVVLISFDEHNVKETVMTAVSPRSN